MEDCIQHFEKAAELLSQAHNLINSRVIGDSFQEVHITDPSPDFIKKHRDIISHLDRSSRGYPHEYSFSLNNIRFYWITRNLIAELSDD